MTSSSKNELIMKVNIPPRRLIIFQTFINANKENFIIKKARFLFTYFHINLNGTSIAHVI